MSDFFGNHRSYISIVFSVFWPVLLILSLFLKKKRETREDSRRKKYKSVDEIKRDHKLFSSIGSCQTSNDRGWPLGYMGFDPKAATDEVIERFDWVDDDKDK